MTSSAGAASRTGCAGALYAMKMPPLCQPPRKFIDRIFRALQGGRRRGKQNSSFGNPADLPAISPGRSRSFAPPGHPGLAFVARTYGDSNKLLNNLQDTTAPRQLLLAPPAPLVLGRFHGDLQQLRCRDPEKR